MVYATRLIHIQICDRMMSMEAGMDEQSIIIHFGVQREGFTFRLHPLSLQKVEQLYPSRTRLMSIYIGYDLNRNRPDIHQVEQAIWDHVATMLTGLSNEEIHQLGGFVGVNALAKEEVFSSLLVYA